MAQDPELVRTTVRLLRECKVDRDRVAELTAEQEAAEDLCRQRVELAEQRLALEKRARELDRREAEIAITELRGQLAAWQARSRDQSQLIEELSKRRKWYCLWMCSKGIKTREIPEPGG